MKPYGQKKKWAETDASRKSVDGKQTNHNRKTQANRGKNWKKRERQEAKKSIDEPVYLSAKALPTKNDEDTFYDIVDLI